MTYTVRELINKSYYTSGKVSRTLETVSGADLSDGLELLNQILSMQAINKGIIPFFTRYEFNAVVGQEEYFITGLLSIEDITFNLDVVRFPIGNQQRNDYFGSSRVDNITTLPVNWHFEREKGGGRIYLFPLPADTYPIKLMGKFGLTDLTSVDYNLDLLTVYEFNYLKYLRYLLAEAICIENNFSFQPQAAQELKKLEKMFKDVSPVDYRMQKSTMFGDRTGFNWGIVNLYRGFLPS